MRRLHVLCSALAALALVADLGARGPEGLSEDAFWALVARMSEGGGSFRSDNLVSNEGTYQQVLPELIAGVRPGGAYLGVGPDQNFTYIAAIDPAIAFVTDIRRGNLQLHLMYKALFELSPTRAEFLERLLSRPRPRDLPADVPAAELFAAFSRQAPSHELFARTRREVLTRLEPGFRAIAGNRRTRDAEGVEYVLEAFFKAGPSLSYSNTQSGRGRYPTFQDLQLATDLGGQAHAYLASELLYARVRSLQRRNLIVPVVGDFAGSHALRAIASEIRARGLTVAAFYTSNVEQYLFDDGIWTRFAENVAVLPVDESSVFIRSCFNNACAASGDSQSSVLLDPITALLSDVQLGRITSYADVLAWRR